MEKDSCTEEVFVYETESAIVRVHPGKRTPEERRRALEESAQRFYKAILRERLEKERIAKQSEQTD